MTSLDRLWNRAKIGLKIWLGPVTLQLRFARSVSVSSNQQRKPVSLEGFSAMSSPQLSTATANTMLSSVQTEGWIELEQQRAPVALIVGVGPGLGSALARRFVKAGMQVALAARNTKKLDGLLQEFQQSGGTSRAYGCDATEEISVKELFDLVVAEMGIPNLVIYNVEHFIPGTILDIEAVAFEECWRAMAFGGFLVGREAARAMVQRGTGTIIFTGATASLRGRAEYINMAVGKFGVRALAQSMARDLGPKGIHVAHVVLDGGILSKRSREGERALMSSMFPEYISETYYQLHLQHRSVWTQELDLRPWGEKF